MIALIKLDNIIFITIEIQMESNRAGTPDFVTIVFWLQCDYLALTRLSRWIVIRVWDYPGNHEYHLNPYADGG